MSTMDEDNDEDQRQLPANRYLVLASRPFQEWDAAEGYGVQKDPESGQITLIHPKRFSRVESLVHRFLGGPDVLRRPLDVYGSRLWELCDGRSSLAQIIEMMEAEFHEAIHPVSTRIQRLLERFVRLGFIRLLPPHSETLECISKSKDEAAGGDSDEKTRESDPDEDDLKETDIEGGREP